MALNRGPVLVLREGLSAHPAVRAWSRSGRDRGRSAALVLRVELLRKAAPVAVYRLVGAGSHGTDVIAKRLPPGSGTSELLIYERVLPHLDLSAPRCYGVLKDGEGRWLFLEDVGNERYEDTDPIHLAVVGRWVAAMHHAATSLPAAKELPDGGATRYLEQLRHAADAIVRRRRGPRLGPTNAALLDHLTERLEVLEDQWSHIDRACTGLPATLVHGDFGPKNVRLRTTAGALACYPIDWETAGWGVPAADLTRVDIAAYWLAARQWRPALQLSTVRRLAQLGHLFQAIAGIDRETKGLHHEALHLLSRPLATLRLLLGRLVGSGRLAGLNL